MATGENERSLSHLKERMHCPQPALLRDLRQPVAFTFLLELASTPIRPNLNVSQYDALRLEFLGVFVDHLLSAVLPKRSEQK